MKAILSSTFCGAVYYVAQGSLVTFECVNEIDPKVWPFKWKLFWAVLSVVLFSNAVRGGSIFWVRGWIPKVWPFKRKLLGSTFLCYVVIQGDSNFWSVDEILLKSVRQDFPVVLDLRLSVSSQVTFSRQLPVNCLYG